MKDRVVITGIGLICSLGSSASETWNALLSGRHGIRQIAGFNAQGFDCKVAAQVFGLNPSELGIQQRDSRIMDTHSYMLMKCSQDAFEQSKLGTDSIPGEEIGYFAGIGMVDYDVKYLLQAALKSKNAEGSINYDAFYSQGYHEIYPLWLLSMLNNIGFCQVAINLGIRGENTVFSPHADSGLQAIVEGVNTILDKKAKVVLAGGVSEKVTPVSLARAHLFGILNTVAVNEEAACHPFSAKRNGTILGEGCGVLALEMRSSADERQVPYKVMITGYSFAFENEEEYSCPTVRAISQSMEKAVAKAELKPSDIDTIITHGDGTYMGDRNEMEAIHQVFSSHINKVNVFSSKGAIGHLFAGASVVDIILGIYMIEYGVIPATLSSIPFEKDIKFNVVCNTPLKTSPKKIMINSQSYEGQSASLIIESIE